MPGLGRNRTLFKVFGFPIKMNPTWILLFGLVVYTFAHDEGWFAQQLGQGATSPGLRWGLAVVAALGLFVSLIIHELCHSLVARRTGMPVKGITLFIFGGVSEMEEEPPTAGSEFMMAVVGPISSFLISLLCFSLWAAGRFAFGFPDPLLALLQLLGIVNMMLAIFNSMPAFPLDGGRVLRSVLWGLTDDLRQATSVASRVGSAFAVMLIVLGVLALFNGVLIGGVWFIFIGFFLRQAAAGSLKQVIMRQALQGETVDRFMTTDPVCVPPEATLQRLVDDYVLPYHYAIYPVTDEDGNLIGYVNALAPRDVERDQWKEIHVRDVMETQTEDVEISPETDAVDALSQLRGEKGKRLLVVEDRKPIGILSLRDLLDFLAIKIDLSPSETRKV